MSEVGKDAPVRTELGPLYHPIGERILGAHDPRKLTRDQFESSADLLYHGSSSPIDFSPAYSYDTEAYREVGEGGQTLGVGFYATDSFSAASNYSRERQNAPQELHVTKVLPYRARVFDFRSKELPSLNAVVPRQLFDSWRDYYRTALGQLPAGDDKLWGTNFFIQAILDDYAAYLDKIKELDKDVTLRVMLDTAPDPDLRGHNYAHPPYMQIFSDFMRSRGHDGLVYVEGGEGPAAVNHTSYVFFNLSTIGTYESWRTDER